MEKQIKRIGILTSGGDAPGMNAVVRAVVRTSSAYGISCLGIRRGYSGLINGDIVELGARSVDGIIAKGGTTSSTVGTEALGVKKARVLGQICPGIPVWQTDPDSKFPGIPYVIFPGNVGDAGTLRQAVEIGYLRFNPADACKLPRVERKELAPLDDAQITAFLQTIKGSRFETLLTVTLFTGMREGEVLGLTWDNVDFKAGTVTISKQALLHESEAGGGFRLGSTKNGKIRTIAPASAVMALLKQHKSEQAKQRLKVGKLWWNTALVFTDEIGRPLTKATVYRAFKKAAAEIGRPDARFHDLRHSYAVAAIRSGDDIKTVQGNLGHATAAFTLDVYGHVTEQMKQESAARMDAYIKAVSK